MSEREEPPESGIFDHEAAEPPVAEVERPRPETEPQVAAEPGAPAEEPPAAQEPPPAEVEPPAAEEPPPVADPSPPLAEAAAVPPAEGEQAPPASDAVAPPHALGDLAVPPGIRVFGGTPNGSRRSVGIAVSKFNGGITSRLLEGALGELAAAGVAAEAIEIMPVPGAFELPLAAMALAKSRRYSCVLALGCVIRGETPHFDYVSSEAASGVQLAGLETGIPVSFGVLTCDTLAQAEARAGGPLGNKGVEAARSALEMIESLGLLRATMTA